MTWTSLDTAFVLTAGFAAMSCALPGVWLVLRQHSMMGDALSHSALPGVVIAFLVALWMKSAGWVSQPQYEAVLHSVLFAGAVVVGIATAWLTEWVQKLGRVEGGAALGVVFTSVFALGLLLIRLFADNVHIDPKCVLFGDIETVAQHKFAGTSFPYPAAVNGMILLVNLALMGLFFKELRIAAFDSALASSLGIPARGIHYGLMAVTAMTAVAAFETVGSILVVGLLIIPGATALLLSERLRVVIVLSLVIAAASALLGHVMARTVPGAIFPRLGFTEVRSAGTAGMMAVAAGGLFVVALVLAPRHGLVARTIHRVRLRLRIAGDDVLGLLYRLEESPSLQPVVGQVCNLPNSPSALQVENLPHGGAAIPELVARRVGLSPWLTSLTVRRLLNRDLIGREPSGGYRLTERGREAARSLVRAHRLWEAYMAKHFDLPDDHLHETAHRVEHFIDEPIQERLETELEQPARDPHGRSIPGEGE